jgi:hypothetical protein
MTDARKPNSKASTEFLVPIILAVSLNLFLMGIVNYVLMEGNVSHKIHATLMGILAAGAAINMGITFYAVKIGTRRRPDQPG